MSTLLNSRGRAANGKSGFTLIELAIVIALILIMASFAIWSTSELLPRWRARQAAMSLAAHVQECRAQAVQANRECMVWFIECDGDVDASCSGDGGTWYVAVGDKNLNSTSWDYLPFDSEADGTDDDQSQGLIDIGDKNNAYYARNVGMSYWGASIGGPGSGNQDRIVFDARGFVRNPASDFDTQGYISVDFYNKAAYDRGNTEYYTLRVTRSGMVRMDSNLNPVFDSLVSGTSAASSE